MRLGRDGFRLDGKGIFESAQKSLFAYSELAHMQLRSHGNAPTTERLCREGAEHCLHTTTSSIF